LRGCHVELNHGIQVVVVEKNAQIRPLTACMRLLRYAAKVTWAYIKYPDLLYLLDKPDWLMQ